MATVDYPSVLPLPTDQGFSRNEAAQWVSSNPQSGPLYKIRRTFDTPTTMSLRFVLSGGQARLFRQWYVEQTDYGLKPFNIDLPSESGIATQEAEFTEDGRPPLSELRGNAITFDAQVYIRQLNEPDAGEFDTLLGLAEISPCNDPNAGSNLLDIIVNEDLPEA